jgi:uracil permease
MLGDGLACMVAGTLGGPPVTTYSEVIGAMSLTKITSPSVIRIAAVTGIVFSMIGKISALLKTIPNAVLGGIMMLLFGMIASVGINNLIQSRTNLSDPRNIIIVSLILTFGIGGAVFQIGDFSMTGIGLAAVLGVILNLILPKERKQASAE